MKSRDTLIRLKKFQVDEKRRKVAQIEGMIAEFDRMAGDLDREIKTEQERAGIHDPAHFAYPTFAKAAMQRKENLKLLRPTSLKAQLDDAKASPSPRPSRSSRRSSCSTSATRRASAPTRTRASRASSTPSACCARAARWREPRRPRFRVRWPIASLADHC